MSVLVCGEILVDVIREARRCYFRVGGSAANVASFVAEYGVRPRVLSLLGRDWIGDFIVNRLKRSGVATDFISRYDGETGLACIDMEMGVPKSVVFYGLQRSLCALDIRDECFDSFGGVFVFGSNSLVGVDSRLTMRRNIECARKHESAIVMDANIRTELWPSTETCVHHVLQTAKSADIIKANQYELECLSGTDDMKVGASYLAHELKATIVVTLGSKGSYFDTGEEQGFVQASKSRSRQGDVIGAGDAFVGGLCATLVTMNLISSAHRLSGDEAQSLLKVGNEAGAIAASQRGGTLCTE